MRWYVGMGTTLPSDSRTYTTLPSTLPSVHATVTTAPCWLVWKRSPMPRVDTVLL